jgi:hypothetical protein
VFCLVFCLLRPAESALPCSSPVLTSNVQALGLTQQGNPSQYTETSCVSTCQQTSTCWVVDYNKRTSTCYFGSNANLPTQANADVNHYIFPSCTGTNTGMPCTSSPVLTANTQELGLTQQGNPSQYTETSCVSTCQQTTNCWVVDYNKRTSTCYFGPNPNMPLQTNADVNHYVFPNCSGTVTGNPTCNTFVLTPNVQANGLVQQGNPGQFTETSCVNACDASNTCLCLDWNKSTSTCYFGTDPTTPTHPNTDINHWTYTPC